MKVEVETQPGSVSMLQIELPPEEVSKEWDAIANSFARFAKIPGYRPGKAPRAVIEKRFRKEIHDELTKKLVSRSYHDAIEQKQLRVVSLTNVEDVQFGDDKSMRFRATVVTAPEFELPEYRNIPVQLPVAELAGKKADYAVTLNEIKQKVLPPIDDAFAARLVPGKTGADLRHMIEHDLEHEKERDLERAKESQIVKFLHEHTAFDLPPPLLKSETRRALNELVHGNRARGVPDDILKGKEKELVEGAGSLAAHRLKTNFILSRIAEREKIEVPREELDARIREEAARYDISVDKMRKELQEHDGLNGMAEQLLLGKTLDFLKANVSVEKTQEPAAVEEKS